MHDRPARTADHREPPTIELFRMSQIAPASPHAVHRARVIHIGLGPIGRSIVELVAQRPRFQTIGAIDVAPGIIGTPLAELVDTPATGVDGVTVTDDLSAVDSSAGAVAIVSTSSDLRAVATQIESCIDLGVHVISTCEELAHPWTEASHIAKRLHDRATEQGISVLGTGVNPGYAMDFLPVSLTGAASRVDHIKVVRAQEAGDRRLPLQRKVGATMTVDEFAEGVESGAVRHVGTITSALAIVDALGWHLDELTEYISPLLASSEIASGLGTIRAGHVRGVHQVVIGTRNNQEVLRLELQMAVDVDDPRDEVHLAGDPPLTMRVAGGFPGDGTTAAVVCNSIPGVLAARPGLHTMTSLAPPRAAT